MSDRVEAFFAGLSDRFRPDLAGSTDAVIVFDITGESGGEWHAIVVDGTCVVARGRHPAPDVTIRAGSKDWIAILDGKLNPQIAFMTGKVEIAGEMGLALRVQKLFFP